jgi:hypothetical protein
VLTPKLTGAGPNVTILKIWQSASIDKVYGLTERLLGLAENEERT